ncbi:MAG: KamA family radical SAM protein [Deltaproteobacteria bacterium]|nr:KamA family radical SAM protein [Deltaproteobacteria bacterium]
MNHTALEDPLSLLASDFDWKREAQRNITTLKQLKEYIDITPEEEEDLQEVIYLHPMNIPRYYMELIDKTDPNDPIRKLAVPSVEELVVAGHMGETTGDPYGDDQHDKGNGILHKYAYSALVIATEYCAMYCRHCFRKRMVGLENEQTVENFQEAAKYIAKHPEITNVIISGGDPMMLPTKLLGRMLECLKDIEHVNYVRIGSRAPVTNPARFFDDSLIALLEDFNRHKALFVPTHFNHVREITPLSSEAVARIRGAGITVNNQAVLLKGVNDSAEAIENLMNGLLRIGVNPYYLYQCMPVARVRDHFQLPLKLAVDLVDEARSRLDGYAKRFKFIIAHDIGKIEIIGRMGNKLVLKQLHVRQENPEEASRLFLRELNETGGWLDDLPEVND